MTVRQAGVLSVNVCAMAGVSLFATARRHFKKLDRFWNDAEHWNV